MPTAKPRQLIKDTGIEIPDDTPLRMQTILAERMLEVAESVLLNSQKNFVFKYYRDGLRQSDIASELGIDQSSVSKALHGNVDYRYRPSRRYGGALHRLQKHLVRDSAFNNILAEISEALPGEEPVARPPRRNEDRTCVPRV